MTPLQPATGDDPPASSLSESSRGPDPEPVIRLRGPGDVVAALPYHLGYQPHDSLVLLCLDGARLGFVGRVDLPPRGVDPWLAVDELLPTVLRERPERVLLVGFETEPERSEALGSLVRDVLSDEGIAIVDRLVVRDGRFYGPDCSEACCPAEGTPVPGGPDVPAVADYVLQGRVPLERREDLDLLLAPGPQTAAGLRTVVAAGRRHAAAARAPGSDAGLLGLRRDALAAWGRLLRAEPEVTETDVAKESVLLAGSLRDVALRDLVIAWMCPGSLDLGVLDTALVRLAHELLPASTGGAVGEGGADARVLVSRLTALCRQTPAEVAAPPLTVLANVTWWHGDGALTRTALDRALEHEPDYRLALLLLRMVDLAIRPRRAA